MYRNRPANHLRIATETAPPQAVAQDYNRRAGHIVLFRRDGSTGLFRREGSTERGRDAKRGKQIGGNHPHSQSLRPAASCVDCCAAAISGHIFKRFRLLAPPEKIPAFGIGDD